jgi:hypothetical protein
MTSLLLTTALLLLTVCSASKYSFKNHVDENSNFWTRLLQADDSSMAPAPTPSPVDDPTPQPMDDATPTPTTPEPVPLPTTPEPIPFSTTAPPTVQEQPNLCDNLSVSVSLGSGSNPNGGFVNVPTAQSLDNVIDCLDVNEGETHTQASHVWWNPAPLELDFDFLGVEHELIQIHFWNYFGETYDVDQIDFEFFDLNGEMSGNLTVFPRNGQNANGQNTNDIVAETFFLENPITTATMTAVLTSNNGQIDFQNLVFTALE